MTTLPVPLAGATLLVGPSNVGKTRLTARALDRWVDTRGAASVVVLDFAPTVERDGEVLGGELTRFTSIPRSVWVGTLDADAPRADGETPAETRWLAAANAIDGRRLIADAPPSPRAVFVNDATIPFHHPEGDPATLLSYCGGADVAVVNAFESDELGESDAISRRERAVLDSFRAAADRTVELGD